MPSYIGEEVLQQHPYALWNPAVLPLSFFKAVSSMADMQAHRGVIYDSCRLGLLSQPGTSPTTLSGAIQCPGGDKPDRL